MSLSWRDIPKIDAHMHLFPDHTLNHPEVAAELAEGGLTGRVDEYLRFMDCYNIERAVIVPNNNPHAYFPIRETNEYTARLVAEHPDRFIGFADINAQSVCNLWDAAQELEYAVKELGLRGLKIHPNNLNMMVDDYRLIPVFRKAADLKIPIIVHCYPPGGPGFVDSSYPEGISRMARVFDDAKIIASHLGGTKHMDLLRAVRMVEISAGLFDLVKWYGDDGAARILRAFGPRRLIFGTDYAAFSPEQYFSVLDRMGFSEDEMRQIARSNIERMLGES